MVKQLCRCEWINFSEIIKNRCMHRVKIPLFIFDSLPLALFSNLLILLDNSINILKLIVLSNFILFYLNTFGRQRSHHWLRLGWMHPILLFIYLLLLLV